MGPSKEKISALEKRMSDLGIKKEDIEEKFVKSSGRGGQKINKTSSAVFLKHKITHLFVKYGKERSQNLNRFLALRNLIDMIEIAITGKNDRKNQITLKIKKQKLRRKAKTKKKFSICE